MTPLGGCLHTGHQPLSPVSISWGIMIFELTRFRPLLLWHLFLQGSRSQTGGHLRTNRRLLSMSSSGLLGLAAGVCRRLKGSYTSQETSTGSLYHGRVLEPDDQKRPTLKRLLGGIPGSMLLSPPESTVYFLYSLGQERWLMIISPPSTRES